MKSKARARANAKKVQPAPPALASRRWPIVGICLILLLSTFVAYLPVRHFNFVNYDDPDYVTRNFHVRQGFTSESVAWAFTSTEAANWFPMARLSHMLDYQIFGLDAGFHHLDSVLIHALSAILLFAFLNMATGALWPSAFVAFAFALHPMHVESVAWIAERKDVLSAFFWFVTLLIYVEYVRRPAVWRYVLALAAFSLGLMSKPMIVTLPAILLLLDFWPLRRPLTLRILVEKIPFFILSGASAIVTFVVQQHAGAVRTAEAVPLGLRVANAFVSVETYIAKTLWPSGLAVFYPYPDEVRVGLAALAAVAILATSAMVWLYRFRAPYLAVGWYWFLVTLAPVIGLVQVGSQARADRYMYVPMIGLLVMLAWGASDVLRRRPKWKPMIGPLAAVLCVTCAVASAAQVQYWRNSEALFERALAVTQNNYLAEHNLGNALLDAPGRLPDAIHHLEAALRMRPDSVEAHTDMGTALARTPDRLPDAVAEYRAALRLAPDSAIPHNNLGNALSMMPGRLADAIAEYQSALRIDPNYAEAHDGWGSALARAGHMQEAAAQFEEALKIDPGDSNARANLKEARAAAHPSDADGFYNLGLALAKTPGREAEAISAFQSALKIKPDYAEAHNNLGVVLARMPNRSAEAIAHFEAAVRRRPEYAEAHYNLGITLSNTPDGMERAIAHFKEAERLHPDPEVEKVLDQLHAR